MKEIDFVTKNIFDTEQAKAQAPLGTQAHTGAVAVQAVFKTESSY